MELSDVVGELKAVYREDVPYRDLDRHLKEEDVDRWSTGCGCYRSQFFDAIARHLVLGFNASELSFDFCDAVVNDLAGVVTNTSGPKPQLFWEAYFASDVGEYHHGDNRDEDPVEAYTRPAIDRIVQGIRTPSGSQHR